MDTMDTMDIVNKQIIYIGADHGGFVLKEKTKNWLTEWKYNFKDLGAFSLISDDDYPRYAFLVANEVSINDTNNAVGILFCRSGAGMVVAANKVKGIRAVDVCSKKSAIHAKEHNNANIISISADWTEEAKAKEIIGTFLKTTFSKEERHIRRVNQIIQYENNR